jgi:hypothetical protein
MPMDMTTRVLLLFNEAPKRCPAGAHHRGCVVLQGSVHKGTQSMGETTDLFPFTGVTAMLEQYTSATRAAFEPEGQCPGWASVA